MRSNINQRAISYLLLVVLLVLVAGCATKISKDEAASWISDYYRFLGNDVEKLQITRIEACPSLTDMAIAQGIDAASRVEFNISGKNLQGAFDDKALVVMMVAVDGNWTIYPMTFPECP